MARERQKSRKNPLDQLLDRADKSILSRLVQQLAAERPEVRRECFEFLKENVPLPKDAASEAEAEALFALWDELEPDLEQLEEYGGGDYALQDHVGELLYDLTQKLKEASVGRDDRRALLDEVMPYIASGNAGMDDPLYDVAYATCQDDEDWRDLAQRLEALKKDWSIECARRIYRRLKDAEKYLELRARRVEYGADYHDLATFHWERGEREKALTVAQEGLKKGKGNMVELRDFLAKRAQESGDRAGFLKLQFAQATDRLNLDSYKTFRKLCNDAEWVAYEPRMMAAVKRAWKEERLRIHMHRQEYDEAIMILSSLPYPDYEQRDVLRIAGKLEGKYPDKVLAFYRKGLGNLDLSCERKDYARKAKAAAKVRHMWLDILGQPEKWQAFVQKTRAANQRRRAFQEEFGKVLPDWTSL